MKIRTTLFGAAALALVGGGLGSYALADYQGDCPENGPVSVYTDDLNHYLGVCVTDGERVLYVQVNELAGPPEELIEVGGLPFPG